MEGGEAEQDRDGAPVHLGAQGHALGRRLGRQVELAAPRRRVGVVLGEGEGHRAPGGCGQAAHPRHLPLGRGQILAQGAGRGELEHACAQLAEHGADAEELVLGGERARHGLAVDGPVGQRARGREAEGTRLDALADEGSHGLDVVLGRRLVLGSPLAHDERPHGAVGDLGADVDRPRLHLDGVEVLGEALPAPPDALRQGSARDVLDPFHQADEPVMAVGGDRREADATVAHHQCGDPVRERRVELIVPGDLAVVVRVHVDPTGRDDGTVGVDLPRGPPVDSAHVGHDPVIDGHVGGSTGRSGPVDHRPAPDHQIVHLYTVCTRGRDDHIGR